MDDPLSFIGLLLGSILGGKQASGKLRESGAKAQLCGHFVKNGLTHGPT